MSPNRHERTDADRERDRRHKAAQRERAKHRPDAMIYNDWPEPGNVPAGFGSRRAKGRGNVIAPPPVPDADSLPLGLEVDE